MRPKIMTCHSISRSLKYNEEKITQGKAECLTAANFLKSHDRLSFEDKLHCFERRMELNERVTTNLHITLNFDPSDNLSNEEMQKIARIYMKEIGFERQPYLVYRHYDAGHPHCHIVTTHIRNDGSPIELYNIGRNQSETARQHIETEFGLVTAEMKQRLREQKQEIDGVPRITYGEESLARSMSRVLECVTENFKYTSLEELNAVLKLYNVEAYRGKEDSTLYQHRGLLYRVLDENGSYIGLPLKASFFDCKPTLDNLEQKFALNQSQKQDFLQGMIGTIQWELFQAPRDFDSLKDRLFREGTYMIQDNEGEDKGIIYVDFQTKCVFSGSELGELGNRHSLQKMIAERQSALKEEESLQQYERQIHRHSLHL